MTPTAHRATELLALGNPQNIPQDVSTDGHTLYWFTSLLWLSAKSFV